ncbi:MAG TPA: ATP-binding cassette domain-containing protein [Anaerolineales bacterium]|nr:ATP-binding cassette domain-containing protein [Anaerolineales bacterium]
MAKIELIDVSLTYDAPTQDPVDRLLKIEKNRMQEDLPARSGKGVAALDHVNLKIPNGRTFVVVGPSGCGKSTLLRVIAGLNKEYSGKVLYDGEDVQTIEPKDREIGMVFQGYALYPNFNSRGNLSFFFRINKVSDEETRERIQYTSELMGIGFHELLPRKVGTLSGGEKQRVAIARAIVRAPRLLLLDEPLSNLDAKLRVQTRSEIKRLLRRFSITSLYVTHDQVEAIALADQIVIMHQGRVEQVGTYQDIMDNPVNAFVAGFLGLPPMSLLSGGSIVGDKLVLGEYRIPLPERVNRIVQDSQPVTLGMRQEAVNISAVETSTNGIGLPAEVESFEPDYVHRTQTVQLRTGRWTYSALCPLDMNFQTGQRVRAQLDLERLYFFDTSSGLRI